ncbi:MAG: hypothetical protein HKN21_05310 [Candidatus Eisenbacteria bacterium]|uniref:Cysteine dioxygenase n=1 Tax=Eiseniibacteriota bacterium TaxID=2212470 RepID=A0A7Y2EA81_UNCEI|nr:hypothetical protein [Candidatus Eisenbacteria bacterium]
MKTHVSNMAAKQVARRTILKAGAAVLFSVWLPVRLARTEPKQGLEIQDLIDAAERLNRLYLSGGNVNESSYLHEMASVACRLGPVPEIELGPPFRDLMTVGMQHRGPGLALIEWRMKANTIYPAHNHPNYCGFTVGLEGSCRMRNFQAPELYPSTESTESFTVRETQNEVLIPGSVSSMMSSTRNNIHKLHAGETAVRGLDISTLVGEHVGFGFMEINEGSRNENGEYEAVWEKVYGGYQAG